MRRYIFHSKIQKYTQMNNFTHAFSKIHRTEATKKATLVNYKSQLVNTHVIVNHTNKPPLRERCIICTCQINRTICSRSVRAVIAPHLMGSPRHRTFSLRDIRYAARYFTRGNLWNKWELMVLSCGQPVLLWEDSRRCNYTI